MRAGEVPLGARLRIGGEPGIHQRITMRWGAETLEMRGRYQPGQPWRYDPVLLDGRAITEGEWSATDCWLDANAAAMQMMIEVFRGRRGWSDGMAAGLFDARRALWLERAVRGGPL
jgi:dTDP-4-dehydrorhamnose reductase